MKLNNMTLSGQGLAQPEASQNDILINHKSEPRIDSRIISERAGIQHQSLGARLNRTRIDSVSWDRCPVSPSRNYPI